MTGKRAKGAGLAAIRLREGDWLGACEALCRIRRLESDTGLDDLARAASSIPFENLSALSMMCESLGVPDLQARALGGAHPACLPKEDRKAAVEKSFFHVKDSFGEASARECAHALLLDLCQRGDAAAASLALSLSGGRPVSLHPPGPPADPARNPGNMMASTLSRSFETSSFRALSRIADFDDPELFECARILACVANPVNGTWGQFERLSEGKISQGMARAWNEDFSMSRSRSRSPEGLPFRAPARASL